MAKRKAISKVRPRPTVEQVVETLSAENHSAIAFAGAMAEVFHKPPPDMTGQLLESIDSLTIPPFLLAPKRKLTATELEAIFPRSVSWAPFRDHSNDGPKPAPGLYVDDPRLPIIVNVRQRAGVPPVSLSTYDDFEAFKRDHDFEAYPVVRTATVGDDTVVLCSAKPWAKGHELVTTVNGETMPRKAAEILGVLIKEEPAPAKREPVRNGRSKVNVIGDLLLQAAGTTTAEILAATGWPSVSVPAQAKMAGLSLRSEKVKGSPKRYWGTKL